MELVRIARRGSHNSLRLVIGATLLATLMAVYSSWFPVADMLSVESKVVVEPSESARFAEAFVFIMLVLQLVVVVLLTPFHVAASIVEDRQNRNLEFLLASPLGSREIIFGKLSARLLFVTMLLLMVLPLLALMQFWGGIDMKRLLEGYTVIIFTMLALGGLSARLAVDNNSIGKAVLGVYLLFFGVGIVAFCCTLASPWFAIASPFAFLWMLFNETKDRVGDVVPLLAILYSLIGLSSAFGAARLLRDTGNQNERIAAIATNASNAEFKQLFEKLRSRVREMDRPAEEPTAKPVVEPLASTLRRSPPAHVVAAEPLDEDEPLLWKENNYPRSTDWFARGGCIDVILVFLMAGLATGGVAVLAMALLSLAGDGELGPLNNLIVRWFGLLLLYGWCFASGLRAAASVTRERQDRTLDSLLTLPVSRRDILVAKWLSCFRRGQVFRWGLVALAGLGVLSTGLSILAVPLAAIYAIALEVFCVTLGIWLSTISQSTLRATVCFVAVLVVLSLPPIVLEVFSSDQAKGRIRAIDAAISPTAGWQAVAFFWRDYEGEGESHLLPRLAGAFVNVLGMGLISCTLWFLARRRFEREGKK